MALVSSHQVTSKTGEKVTVRFYDDGSIRFEIDRVGPMAITEAFLPGGRDRAIIKVIPL